MFGAMSDEQQRAELLLDGAVGRGESSKTATRERDSAACFAALCARAGLSRAERTRIAIRISVEVAACCVAAFVLRSWIPFGAATALVSFEALRVSRLATTRIYNFERDYTALLLSLASAIRTGLDPLSALQELLKLFEDSSEVKRELVELTNKLDAGVVEEKAIREFGATIAHPDVPLFTTAFILSRREGSSLAECLQRLARVTRQRQSFRRKIRSAIAMQKLSAIGIGLSAVAIGLVQVLSNPKGLEITLASPLGLKLLEVGGFLIGAGMLWMTRLASPKI